MLRIMERAAFATIISGLQALAAMPKMGAGCVLKAPDHPSKMSQGAF
jgi:hypothetical protein